MADTYEIGLVSISIGVAIIASYVAASAGGRAHFWITGGIISLGAGIWALQFIGMLALELPIQMSYDIPITLLSLLIAVLVSGFALRTANVALEKRTVELSESNALLQQQMQERIQAENAMRESEERFRAAFEQAGVGMGLRDIDPRQPRWLRVNQKLCDILGYTREELLQLTSVDITPPEDRQVSIDNLERLRRGEISSFAREKRYVRKDGRII